MDIFRLLQPSCVIPHLRAGNKRQALLELARRASASTGVSERGIGEVLFERERLGSTGIGAGIAIPHGKMAELPQLFGMFARLDRPIPFEAIDGEPVDLLFMLLAPPDAGADHLKALSRISRFLRDRATCEKLRGATNGDALYVILTQQPQTNAA